jgi:hypothetical protein
VMMNIYSYTHVNENSRPLNGKLLSDDQLHENCCGRPNIPSFFMKRYQNEIFDRFRSWTK